ncbi:hypothetical protein NMY22_g15895 [Coprinellus aureogranulatus]|nr:hypothetical protein NMY22_g15895 [Coprinellus aureogranulatus]
MHSNDPLYFAVNPPGDHPDFPIPFSTLDSPKSRDFPPPPVFVCDPPRERLLGASTEAWGLGIDSRLAIVRDDPDLDDPGFYSDIYAHYFDPLPRPTVEGMPAKRRLSVQSILVPTFLQGSSSTPTSPDAQTGSFGAKGDDLALSPLSPTSPTAIHTSPRDSPPPDFLLDDDPFANLTTGPTISRQPPNTPTSPPPPLPDGSHAPSYPSFTSHCPLSRRFHENRSVAPTRGAQRRKKKAASTSTRLYRTGCKPPKLFVTSLPGLRHPRPGRQSGVPQQPAAPYDGQQQQRRPPQPPHTNVSFQNTEYGDRQDYIDPNTPRARNIPSAYHHMHDVEGHGAEYDPSKVYRKKSLVRPDREKIDPHHRQFHYRNHVAQMEEEHGGRIGVMPSSAFSSLFLRMFVG